jgi:methyl-accepting chemotaxis protein
MFERLSIRKKLLFSTMIIAMVPLFVIFIISIVQIKRMNNVAENDNRAMALNQLTTITQSVISVIKDHNDMITNSLKDSMNVVRDLIQKNGGLTFSGDTVPWKAVNPLTQETVDISLPKMQLGNTWLGQIDDMGQGVPLVDEISKMFGHTCTVLQRMNETGDMLRVATNVPGSDGKRTIGTYVPAVEPDGKPNPVVSTILAGNNYSGRAFVVDKWYITAYEPIFDSDKKIIGMIYIGDRMESDNELRNSIMDYVIGKTGYVCVLDSKGKYVISNKGERDGEDISGEQDSNGRYFIREMVDLALKLDGKNTVIYDYYWKNSGDAKARLKHASIGYFKEWDWIVISGAYEEEFFDAAHRINAIGKSNIRVILFVIALSFAG